jgi:hypothetical protein
MTTYYYIIIYIPPSILLCMCATRPVEEEKCKEKDIHFRSLFVSRKNSIEY